MAYTVKQVAAISGVSVRTLHFYDETGLLKPSYHGANRYRYYGEPEILTLQQILFYRELGFELKEIQRILGRADFEKLAALQSHRKVLEKDLRRKHRLIATSFALGGANPFSSRAKRRTCGVPSARNAAACLTFSSRPGTWRNSSANSASLRKT